MAVSSYSTNPADNTSISGITVTDATVPDALDNIIRQLMADIRAADDANSKTADVGSSVQAYDALLTAIAALSTSADEMIYSTGSDAVALTTLTSFARTLLDDTTAAAARTTLGVVGGMEFIESQDASSSATLDFTGFDSATYDSYVFELGGLIPASDGDTLHMLTSTNGGSSYSNGASDYNHQFEKRVGGTPTITDAGGATGGVAIANLVGNATADAVSGTVKVVMPHLAVYTAIQSESMFITSSPNGSSAVQKVWAHRAAAEDVDAVRFLFLAGNIASGTITMYGLRNAV